MPTCLPSPPLAPPPPLSAVAAAVTSAFACRLHHACCLPSPADTHSNQPPWVRALCPAAAGAERLIGERCWKPCGRVCGPPTPSEVHADSCPLLPLPCSSSAPSPGMDLIPLNPRSDGWHANFSGLPLVLVRSAGHVRCSPTCHISCTTAGWRFIRQCLELVDADTSRMRQGRQGTGEYRGVRAGVRGACGGSVRVQEEGVYACTPSSTAQLLPPCTHPLAAA